MFLYTLTQLLLTRTNFFFFFSLLFIYIFIVSLHQEEENYIQENIMEENKHADLKRELKLDRLYKRVDGLRKRYIAKNRTSK